MLAGNRSDIPNPDGEGDFVGDHGSVRISILSGNGPDLCSCKRSMNSRFFFLLLFLSFPNSIFFQSNSPTSNSS
jgi:hypothetical protein